MLSYLNWHWGLATGEKEIGGGNWRKLGPAKLFNWHWGLAIEGKEVGESNILLCTAQFKS